MKDDGIPMSLSFEPSEQPIEIQAPDFSQKNRQVQYSIGTLVRNRSEYDAMRATFVRGGFDNTNSEYLFIDNTKLNQTCAYRGLNLILNAARGDYVILCHQDVRLLSDNRTVLETRLAQLDTMDPRWALAGNAGGTATTEIAIRITDPHGSNQHIGMLPAKVVSLDENFIIVRREARLRFSNDLSGFHFYGADICLHADINGYNSYVIDFHLEHLGSGTLNADFFKAQNAFEAKWTHALRRRVIRTTCTEVRV